MKKNETTLNRYVLEGPEHPVREAQPDRVIVRHRTGSNNETHQKLLLFPRSG